MARRTLHTFVLLAALATALALPAAAASKKARKGGVPDHPSKLSFAPLEFSVPSPDGYRHELPGGIPVWIAEDHDLPLATVAVTLRAGSFLEGEGETGVASTTGAMLRQGGTTALSPEEFDEKADFLAANVSAFTGDTRGGATINCTTNVLDECLDLLFDMMRNPRFDEKRLEIRKDDLLEGIKQRNDDAGSILGREWAWLLYGEDHFSTRQLTGAEVEALSSDTLRAWHAKYWRPDLMMFTVAGDVDTKSILAGLASRVEGWSAEGPDVPWPPPAPTHEAGPGVYHVEKDIPQGKVRIGHRSVKWDDYSDKRFYAAMVMNDILGGGGFTSRMVKRIRSDEGLAYSAGSSFGIGTYWPATFAINYQSKNATVAFAAQIAIGLVETIRTDLVSEEELRVAKGSFIDSFPRRFESPAQVVSTFAEDEFSGRPHSYWSEYRDRIRAVTREDVRNAAKEFLHPDKFVFLVVGKWDEIAPGDPDGKASMAEFFGGEVTRLPLRDPMTLRPLEE